MTPLRELYEEFVREKTKTLRKVNWTACSTLANTLWFGR